MRPLMIHLISFLLVAVAVSTAQDFRGTILGRVTDSTDAVVPDVSINITNISTGVRFTTTTNAQGNYLAPYLNPGIYELTAEKSGFSRYDRGGIELRINDRLEVNIPLTLGTTTQTLVVNAESPILETTEASLGQVVDSRRITELPIPHANPFLLVSLAPGSALGSITGSYNANEPYNFYGTTNTMSGVRDGLSDFLIDGMPATHRYNANELIGAESPIADLVAEFKVQTTTLDSAAGNTMGGVVSFTTKAGTNDLHGTANYITMTPELNANQFFANLAGQPRPPYTYHHWVLTATGPVTLPGIYHGKNRTFFSYGYEGIHDQKVRGSTLTVPTSKERQGDFSDLLALGSSFQVYNPFSRRPAANGRVQSDPFPGNILPPSLISPIATKILSFYPMPLVPGTADGINNYPQPNLPTTDKYFNHTARVDHSIGARHRLFGRFNYSKGWYYQLDYFADAATGDVPLELAGHSGTVNYVFLATPTFVWNVSAGYVRFVRTSELSKQFPVASLGFPASFINALSPLDEEHFPYISMTGYTSTGHAVDFGPREVRTLSSTVDKVAGNHTFKFGMEFRAYRQDYEVYSYNFGNFTFGTSWTSGPLDNSPAAPDGAGQSVASLLLGLPTSGYVRRPASYAEQSTDWSLYVEDSWKLTRRLSLTLGLRYEFEGPLTERFNRSVAGFDFSSPLPIQAQVGANYALNPTAEIAPGAFAVRGGLTFAGVGGLPRTLYDRDMGNVMPRFGLAFSPMPKTVIRGGFGIFSGFLGARAFDVIQTGYQQDTTMVPSLDNGLTFTSTLANPFPGGIQEPVGSSLGLMTNVGNSVSFFPASLRAPRAEKWQVGVQRELPAGFMIEVSYVGNYSSNLLVTQNFDGVPLRYLSTSPVRDQATINYLTANLPNPFYPLLPGTGLAASVVPRSSLLTPYPQFTGITATMSSGKSWYDALQARLEKRFAHGYTFQASFTWSMWNEAMQFLNAADPNPSKCAAVEDTPLVAAVSGIYELPIGRGRKWLSKAPRGASGVLSGWQVEAMVTSQEMIPLAFGNVLFTGNEHDIPLPSSQRSIYEWFNVNAGFNRNSSQQLANNVRTFPVSFSNVLGPPLNNVNLSLLKRTKITEKARLEFRGEFTNAFNHPAFGAPNTSPTSTAFGTITSEFSLARRTQLGLKLVF